MVEALTLLVFLLEGQRYGLRLSSVQRVVSAAEVTPLPKAPSIVLGVLNIGGALAPLIDLRRRFSLPERAMKSTDRILLARTPRRAVCLLVDKTEGLIEIEEEKWVAGGAVLPHLDHIEGLVKLEDGIVLIHDLERCLSLEEEEALDIAIEELA